MRILVLLVLVAAVAPAHAQTKLTAKYTGHNKAAIVDESGNAVHYFEAIDKANLKQMVDGYLAGDKYCDCKPCTCGAACPRNCSGPFNGPRFAVTESATIFGRQFGYTVQSQRPFVRVQAGGCPGGNCNVGPKW